MPTFPLYLPVPPVSRGSIVGRKLMQSVFPVNFHGRPDEVNIGPSVGRCTVKIGNLHNTRKPVGDDSGRHGVPGSSAGGMFSTRPTEIARGTRDIETVSYQEPPRFLLSTAGEAKSPQPIPISLDTVLRLAQDQNGRSGLLHEARRCRHRSAICQQAAAPEPSMGFAAYRHDGGIQDLGRTGSLPPRLHARGA